MCILLIFVVDVSLKSPLGTWNKPMYVWMYVQSNFLDHALSICNVCSRCLISFPSDSEMAEEQAYF